MSEFVLTQVGEKHIWYGVSHAHISRGGAPASQKCFGTPTYAQTVWAKPAKFGTWRSGVLLWMSHVPSQGGPHRPQFCDFLHGRTQYEKQEPDFAWWSN